MKRKVSAKSVGLPEQVTPSISRSAGLRQSKGTGVVSRYDATTRAASCSASNANLLAIDAFPCVSAREGRLKSVFFLSSGI